MCFTHTFLRESSCFDSGTYRKTDMHPMPIICEAPKHLEGCIVAGLHSVHGKPIRVDWYKLTLNATQSSAANQSCRPEEQEIESINVPHYVPRTPPCRESRAVLRLSRVSRRPHLQSLPSIYAD